MASTEQNMKTYRGNCHCGAFILEVDSPEIKSAAECNCSICFKKGYAWSFPGDENVRFIKGDANSLTQYGFMEKNTIHRFCPTCGTPVMAVRPRGPEGKRMALNVRCLQGVNVWDVKLDRFDGAGLPPPYQPPVYTGPEPEANVEGGKIYHGSCHCGAVTLAAKIQPLDSYPGNVVDCDCSICRRIANIWIYPFRPQVVIRGEENLQYYGFQDRFWLKTFCKTCGVPISNERNDSISLEVVAAAPKLHREFYRPGQTPYRPINLRTLNNLEEGVLEALTIVRNKGWDGISPQYVNP